MTATPLHLLDPAPEQSTQSRRRSAFFKEPSYPYIQNSQSGVLDRPYTLENDYQIDRDTQHAASFSGIPNFKSQDLMATESGWADLRPDPRAPRRDRHRRRALSRPADQCGEGPRTRQGAAGDRRAPRLPRDPIGGEGSRPRRGLAVARHECRPDRPRGMLTSDQEQR